jgi:threonine aldolase
MDRIDFRSDTVSWPTQAMRQAMANAAVGDDVFGEDPTVNRLQELAARRLGKEAGLFVASGTMGNLVAVLAHCTRGDEVILGDKAHTFVYEAGGIAALGGVHPHPVPVQPDGTLPLELILAAIRPDNVHMPPTRLIALENTQGTVGGVAVPKTYIDAVAEIAKKQALSLHVDGARIFNAAVALNCDVADLVAAADSVMFCLSKGLCAPVGSVLVGSRTFIEKAHRIRKLVGGGMRQLGVLAAAGIIALEQMTTRLADDHVNARRLAEGLAALPQFEVDLDRVQTNMVFFKLGSNVRLTAPEVVERLKAHNIWLMAMDEQRFRAVTHYWIHPEHIDLLLEAIKKEVS